MGFTHADYDLSTDIVCWQDLANLLSKWARYEGWNFWKKYRSFFKNIGIKIPVILKDMRGNSFQCISNNTVLEMKLQFGDENGSHSEVIVIEKNEIRRYEVCAKKRIPVVNLKYRIVEREDLELTSYYSKYFCHRIVKRGKCLLRVDMEEPNMFWLPKKEFITSRNQLQVENYLLNLDLSHLNTLEVKQRVCEIMSLSNSEREASNLMVSYECY